MAQPPADTRSTVRLLGLLAGLAALTAAAYLNSLDGAFVFDDAAITDNPHLRQLSWQTLLSGEAMQALPQSTLSGRPLVTLSFTINHAISGGSAAGYRAGNVLIHLAAGWTLFGLLRRTLERVGAAPLRAALLAFSAASVWLLHPLQTSAVTYIVQRAESLMGLFYLLTVYAAARALVSARPRGWVAAAVALSAAGMACKESMATAPLAVVAWCWVFHARSPAGPRTSDASGQDTPQRGAQWPLFVGLACTWAVPVALAQGSRSDSAGLGLAHVTPWTYLLTQCQVIWHYLRLAACPDVLCIDYDWPIVRSVADVWPQAVGLIALGGATVAGLARRRAWSFPAAWVFLTLGPTSSVIPITDAAFEHRMYLPLAGLAVLVVCGVDRLAAAAMGRNARLRTALSAIILVLALAALTWRTAERNHDYQTATTLWQSTVNARPGNPRARYCLGCALQSEGRHAEAIEHYRRALEIAPRFFDVYVNLGVALDATGEHEQAARHFRWAIELRPGDAKAHYNLGLAMEALGRTTEARAALLRALELRPDWEAPRRALGRISSRPH